jgi:glycosyltransferase involved in cell wall biosynthesis
MVDTLEMGGTERMSVNIAGVMYEEGWESHLIVSRRGGGMESHVPEGVIVHFLRKRAFYDLPAFWRLIRLVQKYRPTIIHAHSTSIYWAVLLKILIGKFRLVWHDHFGLSDQLGQHPRKEFVILVKWIDRIVTVNKKLEIYWKTLLPYRESDIATIGNFPWLLLNKLDKYEIFTFLNLANLRKQKDQLNLLQSAKVLEERGFDFQVLLVGEYVEEDWTEKVRQSIIENNLQAKVKLIGPSHDVGMFLSKSHVGVLSSESEGLPVSLLEYGLAGLPVVCTAVGDCSIVISSTDLGFIVPPSDSWKLAEAMITCLESYPEVQHMGANLQKKVEREYGKNSFLDSYWKLMRSSS